jgi:hypothetical protein
MSIKSGQMTGRLALTSATDNTVSNPGAGITHEFYNIVVSDSAGTGMTVDLYLSADATSATAERIERVTLGANETKSFFPVGVLPSQYLIAKPSAAGAILHGEYIYRDGADA